MVRWAVIVLVQDDGNRFVVRKITEDRIEAWVNIGYTVLIKDTEMLALDIGDVRQDDERGRR